MVTGFKFFGLNYSTQGDLSEKKFCDARKYGRKLDRHDGRNSYLDGTMSDGFFYMWRFVRRRLDFLIVAFLQEYRYTTTKL